VTSQVLQILKMLLLVVLMVGVALVPLRWQRTRFLNVMQAGQNGTCGLLGGRKSGHRNGAKHK
jgi:hypothetical protein